MVIPSVRFLAIPYLQTGYTSVVCRLASPCSPRCNGGKVIQIAGSHNVISAILASHVISMSMKAPDGC